MPGQLIALRQRAGCGNRLNARGHTFADAVDFEQARSVGGGGGEIDGGLLGGFSGTAIAADAKAVRAVDLHEIGGFCEQPRHGLVVHGRNEPPPKVSAIEAGCGEWVECRELT
jgi:hypothetical protein